MPFTIHPILFNAMLKYAIRLLRLSFWAYTAGLVLLVHEIQADSQASKIQPCSHLKHAAEYL